MATAGADGTIGHPVRLPALHHPLVQVVASLTGATMPEPAVVVDAEMTEGPLPDGGLQIRLEPVDPPVMQMPTTTTW